jgi:penicillin amidase
MAMTLSTDAAATAATPATTPSPAVRPRGRWRGRLGIVAALVVVLAADLFAGGALLIGAALPQVSGTLHVAGVDSSITITRDHYGVPHIMAADLHDAFFAQGYVTAQDRLWQMEFNRRVAAGRLAEILGPSALPADRFLRTLGLDRTAEADVQALQPVLRTELDAYTAGVNAFLNTHQQSLPLEFRLLGFTPEPWHDTDSIAYGKVVALDLDGAWNFKLARFNVLAKAGAATTAALFPGYPADNRLLKSEHLSTYATTVSAC